MRSVLEQRTDRLTRTFKILSILFFKELLYFIWTTHYTSHQVKYYNGHLKTMHWLMDDIFPWNTMHWLMRYMVSKKREGSIIRSCWWSLCNPLEIMFSCWLCFYLTILLLSLRVECYSFHKRSQTHHDLNSRRVWAFNGFADITNRLAKKFRY